MIGTAEANELESRAELRAWYRDHLRPMLVESVTEGLLEHAALEHLDFELAELFGPSDELERGTA